MAGRAQRRVHFCIAQGWHEAWMCHKTPCSATHVMNKDVRSCSICLFRERGSTWEHRHTRLPHEHTRYHRYRSLHKVVISHPLLVCNDLYLFDDVFNVLYDQLLVCSSRCGVRVDILLFVFYFSTWRNPEKIPFINHNIRNNFDLISPIETYPNNITQRLE